MSTLARAIQIAAKAHADQTDKAGLPYITHPLRVMDLVKTEEQKIAAVLHDVVEDTKVTLDILNEEGFSKNVLCAVDLLTHGHDTPYYEYVHILKENDIAKAVKLADLTDNTRLDRVLMRPTRIGPDTRRLIKYIMSYKYLTDQIDYETYKKTFPSDV